MEERGIHRANVIPSTNGVKLTNRFNGLQIEDNAVKDNSDEQQVTEDLKSPESYRNCAKPKRKPLNSVTNNSKVDIKFREEITVEAEVHNSMNCSDSIDESTSDISEKIDQESVPSEGEDLQYRSINVETLAPEKLFMIQIQINGFITSALIDTGATNNLMKESIKNKAKLQIEQDSSIQILGLGSKVSDTLGMTHCDVSFYKNETEQTEFQVVTDGTIQFPVILGRQFCSENKLIIDFAKRKISKMNKDGSRTDIYLNKEDTGVKHVAYEGVHVYLSEDVELSSGIAQVSVYYGVNMCHFKSKLYFDGNCKNKKVKGIEGILDSEDVDNKVFIKNKIGEKEQMSLKKGSCIGTVNTVLELVNDGEEENKWTLKDIQEKVNLDELNDEQQRKVYDTLFMVNSSFGIDEFDIGNAKVSPYVMELTDYTPIWQKARSFSEPINVEIANQCDQLELLDIIEKCDSKWSSPIVPVRKTDGTLRMCVDYRKVNKVTKPENFPIPNLTDSIYKGNNIKYFSKMDLIKGYYQVPIDPDSRKFTAFSTPTEQYQFKRLSFGLRNSGIQFQKNMQEILSEFKHKRIIIYQDDILIMSESFEDHLILIKRILTTLMNYGIKVKIDKCEFFKTEVTFLGHLISRAGIKKSPEFIEKIKNFPRPTNVTELRRFLGLANFQRKFVDQFSVIARPLTSLTGGPKRKLLKWTDEMNFAFETLKDKLCVELTLSFPDYNDDAEPLELYVDASGTGAGACLMQKQGNEHKPIAYSSTAFSPAEQKYSTIERELLALRWGVKNFRSFLFGIRFIIYTDHKPLKYLHNMSNENARLMRTLNELEDYQYTIRYKPGCENDAADCMSRIIQNSNDENQTETQSSELPKGLKLLEKSEGGGNSMFESIFLLLEENKEELDAQLPDNQLELRKYLVEHLMENPTKFDIKLDKVYRQTMRIMKRDGILPCEKILLAACDVYNLIIMVHHGMKSPVMYQLRNVNENTVTIHLQCISGIHFNPVIAKKQYRNEVIAKNINVLHEQEPSENVEEVRNEIQMINVQIEAMEDQCQCNHADGQFRYVFSLGNVKFCGIIDTGAEVSVVSESVWKKLVEQDQSLKMTPAKKERLLGVGETSLNIEGIADLKLDILSVPLDDYMPFAILKDEYLPSCAIIGANFLTKYRIVIDFNQKILYCTNSKGQEIIYPLKMQQNKAMNFNNCCKIVTGSDSIDDSDTSSEENSNEAMFKTKIKYIIDKDNDFISIQDSDHAVSTLKYKLENKIVPKQWLEGSISQYKRYYAQLHLESGLLVKRNGNRISTVVPFKLMTEIVYRTHLEMAHIGRLKLFEMVQNQFWHPALDKVVRDICRSCPHCQVFKVSRQDVAPPTMKIKTSYPFEMVSVDCMLLPITSTREEVVLVAVDQYSKWLSVIPMHDKKAVTVTKAMHERILPSMPYLPTRILSDNGPEFISHVFNEFLDGYNIRHTYSTPNKPSSNGGVERVNRTIIQLLKGLVDEHKTSWKLFLPKAIIVYNSTVHAETGKSPSDLLMKEAHNVNMDIPISRESIETWTAGHPKFSPFAIGQKVLKKIQRKGTQVKFKLQPRYDGPYSIVKVQPNNVTYLIKRLNYPAAKEVRVHYKQIKGFIEVPDYLIDCISFDPIQIRETLEIVSEDSSSGDDISVGTFLCVSSSDTDDGDSSSVDEKCKSSCRVTETASELNTSSEDSRATTVPSLRQFPDINNDETTKINGSSRRNSRQKEAEHICEVDSINTVKDTSVRKVSFDFDGDYFIPRRQGRKTLSLSDFSCSEHVNYDDDIEDIVTFTHSKTVLGSSTSTNLSKSKSDNMNDLLEFFDKLVINTPKTKNSKVLGNTDQVPREGQFANIMEEAWTVSGVMIDGILDTIETANKIDDVSESEKGDSFDGWDETDASKNINQNRIKTLVSSKMEEIRKQSLYYKKMANSYKKGNNQFLRMIWQRDLLNSESRLRHDISFSDSELENVRVPIMNLDSPIMTRSRGAVQTLPHVQTKPLEYKQRKEKN